MPANLPSSRLGLSVFFPAYNDSGTIASMVIRAVKAASELTSDFEIIVVNDGSADATAEIADELARTYPAGPRRPPSRKTAGYGGALQNRLPIGHQGVHLLYGRRRRSTTRRRSRVSGQEMRPGVDLVNGYKISRSDPFHRIVIGRVYHHVVSFLVRPQGARRRLRFPVDAAFDLRADPAGKDERRHLPGADEKDSRCGLPDRRGPGPSLSPRVRSVAVLQLSGASSGRALMSCASGSRWWSGISTGAVASGADAADSIFAQSRQRP